jgi:hypothetical protein
MMATNRAASFCNFFSGEFSESEQATLIQNSEVGGSSTLAVVHSVVQFKESGVWQSMLSFRFLPPVVSSGATEYLVIGPKPGVRTDRGRLARSGSARRGWCAKDSFGVPREQYQHQCRVRRDALAEPVAHENTLLIKLATRRGG